MLFSDFIISYKYLGSIVEKLVFEEYIRVYSVIIFSLLEIVLLGRDSVNCWVLVCCFVKIVVGVGKNILRFEKLFIVLIVVFRFF